MAIRLEYAFLVTLIASHKWMPSGSKRCDMKNGIVTVLAGAVMAVLATPAASAEPTQVERVQAALDAWLAARAPIEKVTGIAVYVSFGAAGPAIEAFAGKVSRDPDAGPVNQDTLFQMGSTSKSFTVAVILKLEAAGKLSIDDTLGNGWPNIRRGRRSQSATCST
jgi:D-alanyl-D-alanine carboxypeptidase